MMGRFPVNEAKEAELYRRLSALGVSEEQIEESFVRSAGHGGQNVNKTSTCVYLKHLPTGIEVKCQRDRSQALNRYHARIVLAEKLEERLLGSKSPEARKLAKLKKQKQRRARRSASSISNKPDTPEGG